ncbi:MAG: enolase C-terminal domain-like protein [Candidatus Latescibacterota bacterium]|nr:enolase C-terminal domain-like protein [Candidatus Latescibacterota bacterium]
MKITALRATAVRVPRPQAFISSLGTHLASENAVVEIDTDTGISGLGEASSIWDRRGRGCADDINGSLAELLVDRNPLNIRELSDLMDQHLASRAAPSKSGVEMALWDILGKSLDAPVYQLLGGAVRERAELSHSLSMGPVAEMLHQAEGLVQAGYRTLKIKVGLDPASDLANVKQIRKRFPDLRLRVDANMGWRTAEEAARHIRELEPYEIELVEQPVDEGDLEGLRFVHENVNVPIMADESVWTPTDAMDLVRAQAVDVFNVYVAEAGGIGPAARIFAIAEAARLTCIIGSMPELGIGTAAQAHLAFAMPDIRYGSDLNGFAYHTDDIVDHDLRIEGGYLYPPPGPGLGVHLDRERLEKYAI